MFLCKILVIALVNKIKNRLSSKYFRAPIAVMPILSGLKKMKKKLISLLDLDFNFKPYCSFISASACVLDLFQILLFAIM